MRQEICNVQWDLGFQGLRSGNHEVKVREVKGYRAEGYGRNKDGNGAGGLRVKRE